MCLEKQLQPALLGPNLPLCRLCYQESSSRCGSLQVAQILDYLGDVINEKGDNTSLIEDRRQRGISAMVRIEALVRETELGVHTINVHLLLYRALFLSCTLFNSQVWRNLTEKDLSVLEKMQGRCLKRILNVPQSTANSFTYLRVWCHTNKI